MGDTGPGKTIPLYEPEAPVKLYLLEYPKLVIFLDTKKPLLLGQS